MSAERVTIDGVPLDALDRRALLGMYSTHLTSGRDALFVGFYAALLLRAKTDTDYLEDLRAADVVYADGAGAVLALRILGKTHGVERLATTDIWRDFVTIAADMQRDFAVIASEGDSLATFVAEISALGGNVVSQRHGYFESEVERREAMVAIRESGAGVVFIGMGAGKQERFARALMGIPAGASSGQLLITIGGLADHVANKTMRAPQLVQRLGFEWLWRTIQEPRRLFKRYFAGNAYFLGRVLRQAIGARVRRRA